MTKDVFCHDKTQVCHDKTFVATKMILVAAPTKCLMLTKAGGGQLHAFCAQQADDLTQARQVVVATEKGIAPREQRQEDDTRCPHVHSCSKMETVE